MPAPGLADVLAGNLHPLVVGRGGEHPLEQLAIRHLRGSPGPDLPARFGDPRGEAVAHSLQLAEPQGAGPRGRPGNARIDSETRERLGGQPRKLSLEATDLAPHLGAGAALAAGEQKLGRALSVEHVCHTRTECR